MKTRFFGHVLVASGCAVFASVALPASAHHSFASYDMLKVMSQSGTLKEFRWGAPHSSMVLIYTDKNGKSAEMSIVSGSPLMFAKQGFAPRDFKAGDKVTVGYHPNFNGAPGGAMATLTIPGGRTFSDVEAAGIPVPPAK